MKIIHFIKLHNFKVFGEEKTIELDQPSVLIGPNNSGKTSALQALALWSIGVRRWMEAKGNSKGLKNISTGINRLDIIQVPVQEARYFWKNTEIRKGSSNYIPLEITVGVEFKGEVCECKMIFTHYTPEVIYTAPDRQFYENRELIEYVANINVDILYPMSGMIIDETLLPEGRINVLIGQGRTAEVLRNLCYKIVENDRSNNSDSWSEVQLLMKQLFNIDVLPPAFIQSRGTIELKYNASDVKNSLDISLAGRGQQQMLLLIAYLYSHQNAILLLDEPDAHLEILRQKIVFTLLRDLSSRNNNQVIIATHSEVILDEASDNNLVMIIDGNPLNIALKKDIKHALQNFGLEHYYKARLKKSILYAEGSTDIQILKTFAKKIRDEEAVSILESAFNYYYIQNVFQEDSQQNLIERSQGYFKYYKEHFYAVQSVVPEFVGLAIFDSDGKSRMDELTPPLITKFWQLYEIENYFITLENVKRYFAQTIQKKTGGPLFTSNAINLFEQVLDEITLKIVFNENTQSLADFKNLTPALQETFWLNNTRNLKLSDFLEKVFLKYSEISGTPVLLNKGRFYEIIEYIEPLNINPEVRSALDLIKRYISK
jgi:AAA15 family ATPase/GTPase